MNKNKKKNAYWFFRSMYISLILVFCALLLFLGSAECYARIKTTITGIPTRMLEQKNGHIFLLGKDMGEVFY